MASINVSTGRKEIEIIRDGESVGVIYFSPSDTALISRLNEARKKLSALKPEKKEEVDDSLAELDRIDAEARKALDEAFDYPCSDVIFGKSYTFTTAGGASILEQFLEGAIKIIKKEMQDERKRAENRQEKYTSKYHK